MCIKYAYRMYILFVFAQRYKSDLLANVAQF